MPKRFFEAVQAALRQERPGPTRASSLTDAVKRAEDRSRQSSGDKQHDADLVVIDLKGISSQHELEIATAIWNHSPKAMQEAIDRDFLQEIQEDIFLDISKPMRGWVRYKFSPSFEETQFRRIKITRIRVCRYKTDLFWTGIPKPFSTVPFRRDETSAELKTFLAAVKAHLSMNCHKERHIASDEHQARKKLSNSISMSRRSALAFSGINAVFNHVGKETWNFSKDKRDEILERIKGPAHLRSRIDIKCQVKLPDPATGWRINAGSSEMLAGRFHTIVVDGMYVNVEPGCTFVAFHWYPDEFKKD